MRSHRCEEPGARTTGETVKSSNILLSNPLNVADCCRVHPKTSFPSHPDTQTPVAGGATLLWQRH